MHGMAPITATTTTTTTTCDMRTFSLNSSQSSTTAAAPAPAPSTSTSFKLPTLSSKIATTRNAFKRTPSNVKPTTSPDSTTKCATVTMMLAERIIRNDWSVEDEHFFETNKMNVWQTLEFLSNLSSRKRFNYEGYNDAKNALRNLTPSWRRDSFVEKSVNPNADESSHTTNDKYTTVANKTATLNENGDYALHSSSAAGAGAGGQSTTSVRHGITNRNGAKSMKSVNSRVPRKRRDKQKLLVKELDPEYALSPSDYADLIKCTFNLPRISAALERLMGTNVVRLTDRNYMKELRKRIEDDYLANLQKRIKARELKEVERERILIIEGKTKVIPAELADDPIFVVDKKADLEILKSRAKLKTNREKNSDRLKLQGVKWERERLQHEEEEAQRLNVLRQHYKEQLALEEQYKNEDADRSMDLLRINNEDWRICEEELRDFLQQERSKMKERSLRIPTPFTSDSKDINNIVRARKDFRDVERRIRKEIDEKHTEQQPLVQLQLQKQLTQQQSSQQGSPKSMEDTNKTIAEVAKELETENIYSIEDRKNLLSDDGSELSSGESFDRGSTISVAKHRYAQQLQKELDHDVAEGFLISRDQYDHLRYEDERIMQLKNAKGIRELYQLAEAIITGERVESYVEEDEVEEEQEEGGGE